MTGTFPKNYGTQEGADRSDGGSFDFYFGNGDEAPAEGAFSVPVREKVSNPPAVAAAVDRAALQM